MTLIAVNGIIKERVDSTANWEYVNPILALKEKGFEVSDLVSRDPVGMKIGDGIHAWSDLPYWFQNTSLGLRFTIAAGQPNPKNLTNADIPNLSITSIFWIEYNSGTLTNDPVSDQRVVRKFTDSSKAVVESIDVYGNDSGSGTMNETTYLIVQ